jgi:hypothetical protein
MRLLPTRIHGILDCTTALLLLLAPWLFGFARGGAETWVPVALAAGIVLYSLGTRYEWGMVPMLPMRAHLVLDLAGGSLLFLSPWLFGFSGYVWAGRLE